MKKRLSVLLLALVMVISSAAGVMAAPTDFVHTETGSSYSLLQAASSPSVVLKLASSPSAYRVLDTNGNAYSLKEVLDLIATGLSYDEALLEADPVEEELEVIEVSAINATGVEVTFEALEEALEDVTVTVLNNNEVEVAVEAKDLAEEATSAIFSFVEEYEDDLEGVWTVNGVTYDFDEFAAVAKIKASTGNLVELWKALTNENYFTGAVEENIDDYKAAILDPETVLVTAEDVNKMIEEINTSLVDAETEVAIVKAIVAAKDNELKLLNALNDNDFDNVNDELILKYKTALSGITEDSKVKDIQDAIDEVNNKPIITINAMETTTNSVHTNITTLKANADRLGLDLTEFDKLIPNRGVAAINDLIQNKPEDGYTVETLKPIFDEIVATRLVFEESVALFATGTTEAPLTDITYITMLIDQLESVSYELHSNKSIEEERLPDLVDLVDRFNALSKDDQTDVLSTIDYTQTASSTNTRNALDTALKAVEAEVAPREATEAVNALFATKIEEDEEVIDETKLAEGVTQAQITAASKLVEALPDNDNGESVKTGLQSLIKAAQELFDVAAINAAIQGNEAAALQAIIVDMEISEYIALPRAQRSELVQFIIDEALAADEYVAVTGTEAFKTSVPTSVTGYTEDIAAVNEPDDKGAMQEALEEVYDVYDDLSAVKKLDVAEEMFAIVSAEDFVEYTTFAQIRAAVDTVIAGL